MKIKSIICALLALTLIASALAGCGTVKEEKEVNYKTRIGYDGEGNVIYKEERELDGEGRIVKDTNYMQSDDGALYLDSIMERAYNADGQDLSFKYYTTDNGTVDAYLSCEYKYEYTDGKVSKQESYYAHDGEMKLEDYTVYYYDSAKRITKSEFYDLGEDGTFVLASTTENVYQGDFDTPVKTEYYSIEDGEKSVICSYSTTLDEEGREVEHITESEWTHMKEVTEYRKDGKVAKKIAYTRDDFVSEWTESFTETNTFNKDGKVTEILTVHPNGNVDKMVNEFENGKLSKSTSYEKDKGEADFILSYYETFEY